MSIGRNELCPCGSGRKYKRCHGAPGRGPSVPPQVARANALKARDTRLADRLMRFARTRHDQFWLDNVLAEADLLDDTGDLQDGELSIVIPWLLYHRADAAGLTLASEWRQQQRRIEPDDQLILDAYAAAWTSIWEVDEVEAGRGSRLTDVLTGQKRFIEDVSSTATLQRFDTLLAIPISCDDVCFFGGVHSQPLPPRFGNEAVAAARRLCGVRTRSVAPEKLRDPEIELDLIRLWRSVVQRMLEQPPPVLHTTDGEALVLTRDDYALEAARDSIVQRLAALPGVHEDQPEDGHTVFVVTEPGNPMHRSWSNTIIGRIVLKQDRLNTETMSTQRADRLRATLETELRGLVRFRLRQEENTAQLLAAARESRHTARPRPAEPLPPEVLAELRRLREQHMKQWLDESIPALDGLTPREAARLPRARRGLEVLLKEIEQSEARLPAEQRMDLTWLRETLGLTRPRSAR